MDEEFEEFDLTLIILKAMFKKCAGQGINKAASDGNANKAASRENIMILFARFFWGILTCFANLNVIAYSLECAYFGTETVDKDTEQTRDFDTCRNESLFYNTSSVQNTLTKLVYYIFPTALNTSNSTDLTFDGRDIPFLFLYGAYIIGFIFITFMVIFLCCCYTKAMGYCRYPYKFFSITVSVFVLVFEIIISIASQSRQHGISTLSVVWSCLSLVATFVMIFRYVYKKRCKKKKDDENDEDVPVERRCPCGILNTFVTKCVFIKTWIVTKFVFMKTWVVTRLRSVMSVWRQYLLVNTTRMDNANNDVQLR